MPEYIEKIRVTVRVSRPGEPDMDGTVSLFPESEFHAGPQTLLELLDQPAGFVPFQRKHDDAVLLVSREDVQWVLVDLCIEPDLVRPRTYRFTREERVRVRFRDGEEIDGLLQMELPENVNRASDYLNGPERFFPFTTRKGIYLVHKAAVREIRLYDSSPLPVSNGASGQ